MNRGARHAPIFAEEGRHLFLDLLPQVHARYGLWVHAYAVMPNHYHLLVTSPDTGLAGAMKWLDQVFTQRLNTHVAWDGPVFRGRYHDVLVSDPAHWRHLAAYVHLNPVEHRGPERMFDPDWTSHAAFTGAVPTPPWLAPQELLDAHGSREGYVEYVEGIRSGTASPPDDFDPLAFRGERTIPAPERLAVASDDVLLAQVERIMETPLPSCARSRDPIVGVACWWLRLNGRDLEATGAILGLSQSAVSRRASRILERAHADAHLASRMAALSGLDPRMS